VAVVRCETLAVHGKRRFKQNQKMTVIWP